MVSYLTSRYLTGDKVYAEMVALSTDTVDTEHLANGSTLYRMDTDKEYRFDEGSGAWKEYVSPSTPTRTEIQKIKVEHYKAVNGVNTISIPNLPTNAQVLSAYLYCESSKSEVDALCIHDIIIARHNQSFGKSSVCVWKTASESGYTHGTLCTGITTGGTYDEGDYLRVISGHSEAYFTASDDTTAEGIRPNELYGLYVSYIL